jgi:hypothetical protein
MNKSRCPIDGFNWDTSKEAKDRGIWFPLQHSQVHKCYLVTFLIRQLCLIGACLGEDQRTNTTKTHV